MICLAQTQLERLLLERSFGPADLWEGVKTFHLTLTIPKASGKKAEGSLSQAEIASSSFSLPEPRARFLRRRCQRAPASVSGRRAGAGRNRPQRPAPPHKPCAQRGPSVEA